MEVGSEGRKSARLIASGRGKESEITVNQDIDLWSFKIKAGQKLNHSVEQGRSLWLHQISGELKIDGEIIRPGDSAAIQNQDQIELIAQSESEVLVFDLIKE